MFILSGVHHSLASHKCADDLNEIQIPYVLNLYLLEPSENLKGFSKKNNAVLLWLIFCIQI